MGPILGTLLFSVSGATFHFQFSFQDTDSCCQRVLSVLCVFEGREGMAILPFQCLSYRHNCDLGKTRQLSYPPRSRSIGCDRLSNWFSFSSFDLSHDKTSRCCDSSRVLLAVEDQAYSVGREIHNRSLCVFCGYVPRSVRCLWVAHRNSNEWFFQLVWPCGGIISVQRCGNRNGDRTAAPQFMVGGLLGPVRNPSYECIRDHWETAEFVALCASVFSSLLHLASLEFRAEPRDSFDAIHSSERKATFAMALGHTDDLRGCEQRPTAAVLLAYANYCRRTRSSLCTIRHLPSLVEVLSIIGLVDRSLVKRGFCAETGKSFEDLELMNSVSVVHTSCQDRAAFNLAE